MTQFLFANNAATTVGSTFSSLSTTLAVAIGTGILFPSPASGQQFALTLSPASSTTGTPFEICYCTSVSGDTFTVLRAQEGTSALNWAVGDFVQLRWTQGQAAALAQQVDVQRQTGNYGVDTGTANAGVVTLSPAPVSLAAMQGMPIRISKINSANTGGSYTLNVNGFGAGFVVSAPRGGGNLLPGDLAAGYLFQVVWDGANFVLQSELGISEPAGIAGGDLTGTYPNPVIGANEVTNAKAAQAPANTWKGNPTAGLANVQDMALATVLNGLGLTGALGASGYVFLPFWDGASDDRLLVQWGTVSSQLVHNSDVAVTVSFPIQFPNNAYGTVPGIITPYPNNATADIIIQEEAGTRTTSGVTFIYNSLDPSTNVTVSGFYIAFGN